MSVDVMSDQGCFGELLELGLESDWEEILVERKMLRVAKDFATDLLTVRTLRAILKVTRGDMSGAEDVSRRRISHLGTEAERSELIKEWEGMLEQLSAEQEVYKDNPTALKNIADAKEMWERLIAEARSHDLNT